MRFILFAITLFLSSFLLFQVQPIISKYILPWFGGTSAVWTTAMLFFQTFLLLGYGYTLLLSKVSIKKQIGIHIVLVISILTVVGFLFSVWQAPILPDFHLKPPNTFSPVLQVLFILSMGVGLPYFLLSTTSVLLQKWFGSIQSEKSPYPLYSLSNIASLLALISYPFVIEPFLPLHNQGIWWAVGFIIYGLFLLFCCGQIFFSHNERKEKKIVENTVLKRKTVLLWLFLSSVSTLMLLAITNMLTQSIAPIPFLWLLPLSLYLLSFIICFSGKKGYFRKFYAYLFLLTAPIVIVITFSSVPSLLFGIIIFSLVLFSCCMLSHGELYHLRPSPSKLDTFYVVIALGSVISGIFVGIIAPLLFNGFWEIYVGFYLSILLAVAVLIEYENSFISKKVKIFFTSKKEVYLFVLIGYPVVLITTSIIMNQLSGYLKMSTWRNFYGIVAVKERKDGDIKQSFLMHGNIIHGSQFEKAPLRYRPTTYYGPESGAGLVIQELQKQEKTMTVGVIGLGVGTIAAFGRKGDTYVFYEINPQVIDVARSHFTYLTDSPALIDVVLGDGRLALEEDKRTFAVIVLDAFSDDAIPVHIITKEAFQSYLAKLDSNGAIAINISNNYINLKPLLQQVANYFDLEVAFIRSHANDVYTEADWAILTRDKTLLTKPDIANKFKNEPQKQVTLWTDNYSNLFQLLK